MFTVVINGSNYLIKLKLTVLETCNSVGEVIPRFCYHETLSVAGNCRMCLVEIDEEEKPVLSCITIIRDFMVIKTNTAFVKKSRENILESILLNHPLDCPICDQAGECDLQEQTKYFGTKTSKFMHSKREVEDKSCGSIVKTIMTRCIHCTRCVRFGEDVLGFPFLGTLGRGSLTEIGNYIPKIFDSEISGTVIDLCPVGALTSYSYSFELRPWELKCLESIDLTDGLGSNIFIHYIGDRIYRIVPKNNKLINSNYITDKARFSFDANNSSERLNVSYCNNKKLIVKKENNLIIKKLLELSIKNKSLIAWYVTNELDLENLLYFKNINFSSKNSIKPILIGNTLNYSNFYNSNCFNNLISLFENKNCTFFLTSNVKIECSVLNTLIKTRSSLENLKCYSFGNVFKNDLSLNFLNLNVNSVLKLFEGKYFDFSKFLVACIFPFFVLGYTVLNRFLSIPSFISYFKFKLPTIKIIQVTPSSNSESVNYLNIRNLNSKLNLKSKLSFGTNLDNTLINKRYFNISNMYCVWLNTHIEDFLFKSNFVIPISSNFEQNGIYINLEQRPQKNTAIFEKEDFSNMKSLQSLLFFFNNNKGLKNSSYLNWIFEVLVNPLIFLTKDFINFDFNFNSSISLISNYPIKSFVEDFYSSNKQTRNSFVMKNCSSLKRKNYTNFEISFRK